MKTAGAKTKEVKEKPLVNHRWNLPSLGEMLDHMLPEWEQGNHPDLSGPDGHAKLRGAFERFGDALLSRLELSLEKAAGRGIQEAMRMVLNPEYHKTVKRRTKREIEAQKQADEQRQRRRERWKRCEFTQEERLQEIGQITYSLKYHQDEIAKLTERKKLVESGTVLMEEVEPQPETFKPKAIKNDGDGDWPDTISFD